MARLSIIATVFALMSTLAAIETHMTAQEGTSILLSDWILSMVDPIILLLITSCHVKGILQWTNCKRWHVGSKIQVCCSDTGNGKSAAVPGRQSVALICTKHIHRTNLCA